MIEQVRRFNRTVTQRIGALDDAFLARDRPLGQARLLWEIGPDGIDVRRLRARLELDSGYLSRLLRSLTGDDLVSVEPSEADGRVRTARLTLAGRTEQAELDRLSDDAASALLAQAPGVRTNLDVGGNTGGPSNSAYSRAGFCCGGAGTTVSKALSCTVIAALMSSDSR